MKYFLLNVFLCFSMICCGQESRNVKFFKDTEVYKLAQAVGRNDTIEIKSIVKENSKFLEITNPTSGSNVLLLALLLENYESFKTLLELGANPNFINPYTQRSILIDACKFYEKPEPYTIDLRFIELLLKKGANPKYALEKDYTNEKGHYQRATSAIHEASSLDLEMVKLLLKYGADPHKKLEQYKNPPFYESLSRGKIEISNFYIDSLKVNINEPLAVFENEDTKTQNIFYIQDLVVNKFIEAKIQGNTAEMEKLKSENPSIEKENKKRLEFIKKLEKMGVDFKNYEYKKR